MFRVNDKRTNSYKNKSSYKKLGPERPVLDQRTLFVHDQVSNGVWLGILDSSKDEQESQHRRLYNDGPYSLSGEILVN